MTIKHAWSHSAMNEFMNCPKKYYLTRVAKSAKEPPSAAMQWGNKVHKDLEKYAKSGEALPEELMKYRAYVDKIMGMKGKKLIEEQWALTEDYYPTGWFGKDVWVRSIVDIGVVGATKAVILDYKTGKRKPDFDQLKLSAAIAFAKFPWVEEVTTGFLWLKPNKFDKETYTRDQVPELWQDFLPRTRRLDLAFENNEWPATPSGLCPWCPAKKAQCIFSEKV